jgi:hypothetical protein
LDGRHGARGTGMKAVVNAGPLMALGKLGLLQLLPSLIRACARSL